METNQTANDLETRVIDIEDLEIRAGEAGQPSKLVGYAIPYNSLSNDLGGFKERVMPGACKRCLASNQDIRALVDHDPSKLLGRTGNNTLRAMEDERGLRVEIDMPDTSYANDVRTLVKRGDIKGMSFGFKVPDGGQRFTKEGGQTIRELSNIDLREVTVTSIPAYGATSLSVRIDPLVMQHVKSADNQCRPRANLSLRKLKLAALSG